MKMLKRGLDALLISLIWLMTWASAIYFMNDAFPHDLQLWSAIMAACGFVIPWCLIDGD